MVKFHRPTHLLVHFGYPQAHEDDPERRYGAGLTLIQAVTALGAHVSLQSRDRCGVEASAFE